MRGQVIGSLIAAVFGTVYVVVNSGSLPPGVAWPLRFVAVAMALAVAVPAVRMRPTAPVASGRTFGRSYAVVVAIEVVALFVGTRLLSGPLDAPQAGVAWVSVVVGVHFFALAVVLRQRFFHVLAAVLTGCGVLAVILVFRGAAPAVTDLIGGVVPGLVLLGFGLWGVRRRAAAPTGAARLS